MRRLCIAPDGWPCTLEECQPGFFVRVSPEGGHNLGFKTEYHEADGKIQAYNECGEWFVAGTTSEEERKKLIVQPVSYSWEDL